MAAIYFFGMDRRAERLTFRRLVDLARLERRTVGCTVTFLAAERQALLRSISALRPSCGRSGVIVQIRDRESGDRFHRGGFWLFDRLSTAQYERRMRIERERVSTRDPLWTRGEKATFPV